MYKFIQKNQKKFLAVFAVGLMIVFILPQVAFDQNRGTAQEVVAHIGEDEPIYLGEIRQAQDQWREIVNYLPMQAGPVAMVAADIEKNPELFLLLQKEAEQMGLRVSPAQVDDTLTGLRQQYAMFGRQLPNPAALRAPLRSLMLVRALFERVADGIKPTDPLILREIAENGQRVKLNLVHYSTEDFAKDVPAPTSEQLQKQFDQFKNTPPGFPTEQNPFGFGYLIPAKVQLTYLTVSRDEAVRAVRKSKEPIDWETLAVLHYRQNLSKYPVTQPAETQPATTTTASTTTPSSTAPAATRPTTRPFAEVKEQVIREVMEPEVTRKLDLVASALSERMSADYGAYQKKSASAPADFGTRQYLERIAGELEKRHGVRVGISEINDPKDEKGLGELKGIGESFAGELAFPLYVLQNAEPLLPTSQRDGTDVLSLDEPSRALRDATGNVYIFQLKSAEPAHPPDDLKGVKEKLEADVRTRLAFEAAVAAAKKLQEQSSDGKLGSAAKAAGKDVFTTPEFMDRQGNAEFEPVTLIPKVDLPGPSREKLVREAYEMLADATPKNPHPSRVVELPAAGRVVVVELADVERPWQDDQTELLQYQVAQQIAGQRAQRVLADYFSVDAVKRRLAYRSRHEEPTQTASAG